MILDIAVKSYYQTKKFCPDSLVYSKVGIAVMTNRCFTFKQKSKISKNGHNFRVYGNSTKHVIKLGK